MQNHLKAALLGASALLALTGPAAAADFVMRVSSPAPLSAIDPLSAWMEAFEAGVEAGSNGRIDVQLYPASQLGPIPATVEGVAMGTIEMTLPIIGFLSRLEPRFQVLDAGGLFDDERHALRTLSDPRVRAMLGEFGADAGVEPLVVLTSGQSFVVSRAPIDEPADLNGVKLRTGGATPLVNDPMIALGASPVSMPLGEALPALQTGTIDAATINASVAVGFNFADVAPNGTFLPGNFTVIGGLVNRDFLAMIGPDLEAVVRQAAEDAKTAYEARLDSGAQTLAAAWTNAGGAIHTFSDDGVAAYTAVTEPAVQAVIGANPQMQADYDLLRQAATDNR
ncbi:MAG: TRAP transporter substrate-binding protein [Rhodobacter sp.]|nr:TRAP transporter substrate-binding protein [Paracoccaceae bacterium]MCC0077576.1 TRAP transporter substrate-binding protein [Rhodobacter sp.]